MRVGIKDVFIMFPPPLLRMGNDPMTRYIKAWIPVNTQQAMCKNMIGF